MHTTGTDESPLEDHVPVLTVADTRYENDESETDNFDHFDLIWIDKTDKRKWGIPEVLQTPDRTDNKKRLATTDLVTAQPTEPYCNEIAKEVGKPDLSVPTIIMEF